MRTFLAALALAALSGPEAPPRLQGKEKQAGAPPRVEAMREVHARFRGRKGTLACFGDSITVTMAFWAPLEHARKNASAEMEEAFRRVKAHLLPECWREWKGPRHGSEGGMTVRWAHEHIGEWLERLNPEAAVVLFGTNDLHALEIAEYRTKLRQVLERCLANGTVPILTTPPPRHGFVEKAAAFAAAARELAGELAVPLIDLHAEVLRRRPDDWDGALEKFAAHQGYDVPTLIARDGVHPSHPARFRDDYSAEALRSSGYSLRNHLTLHAYAALVKEVLAR